MPAIKVPAVATITPTRWREPCHDVGSPVASVGNASSRSPVAVTRYPATAGGEMPDGLSAPSAKTA